MRVIRGLDRAGERVVALGTFDGVHLGHRMLLAKAKAFAEEAGCPLRVLTFDRHPLEVLRPGFRPELLTTLTEKLERLALLGADEVQIVRFSRAMAETDPAGFLDGLRRRIDLRALAAGWNYTFGRKAEGNAETLREDGKRYGYEVLIAEAVLWKGEPVSSSRVREALRAGDLASAAAMLDAPYTIRGTVIREETTARGIRRAVMKTAPDKLLPAAGRYPCILQTADGYATASLETRDGEAPAVRPYGSCPLPEGRKIRLTLG